MKTFALLSLYSTTLVSPVLSLIWGNGGPCLITCDYQSRCIDFEIRQTNSSSCGTDCTVEVCMKFDFNNPSCIKHSRGTVKHTCVRDSDQCFDNSCGYVPDDLVSRVLSGKTSCVTVKAGEDAMFFINDSRRGVCKALSSSTRLPSGAPSGTTCSPSTLGNYNVDLSSDQDITPDVHSCASVKKAGQECVWRIPTTDFECTNNIRTDVSIIGNVKVDKVLHDPRYPTPGPGNGGAGVTGDPHFKTWSGERYDYHGACDMVLLRSKKFAHNIGLDIHIRTRRRGRYSYVSAAAVRIGDDILEVTGMKDHTYHVNGVRNVPLPVYLPNFSIEHSQVDNRRQTFAITAAQGQQIVIKTWRDIISVNVGRNSFDDLNESVGLLGSYTTGERYGRNGTIITDVNDFGQDWQVLSDEDVLFSTLQMPQHPQPCALPVEGVGSQARRRLEEAVSESTARLACSHCNPQDVDFCIYDVLATNDVKIAEAY